MMTVSELVRVRPNAAAMSSTAWRSQMCQAIEGVEIIAPGRDTYGEFLAFDFAGARMYYLHSVNQRIFRPKPSRRRRFAPMAAIQLEGESQVTQLGRRCELKPGAFAYFNAAGPISIDQRSSFKSLYLMFPEHCFNPAQFLGAVGVQMGGDKMDRLFHDCAAQLWDYADDLQPVEHINALNALISLSGLTGALRNRDEQDAVHVRVDRARAFIEHNLGEAWLSPEAVAAAQNISRRYLEDLFGASGFRIERWIWERRVQRAKNEMRLYSGNCGPAQKSIVQIALDVGFKSPSHFSRTFTKRFGMSPREYRLSILASAAQDSVGTVARP